MLFFVHSSITHLSIFEFLMITVAFFFDGWLSAHTRDQTQLAIRFVLLESSESSHTIKICLVISFYFVKKNDLKAKGRTHDINVPRRREFLLIT